MRSLLERMARAAYPPMYTQMPEQAKAAYEAGAGVLEVPKAPLARVEDFSIPSSDGAALPARLYAPGPAVMPVLLYFHGGGFTIGSIASHDTLCRELSRLAGCAVVSLGYRLAPAHRFPTAVNDAWDALRWLAGHARELGCDSRRLAVGGDSAGGTLATVCAILAREHGLELALQLLFYPGCAATGESRSHRRYGRGLILEEAHIEWFFD
ncbi:MAG TPA: alpha/beta hydrolase, partial [Ramlibacter sp.]|nr:alpha/beta hydrolase [Ramlibacter sp.]